MISNHSNKSEQHDKKHVHAQTVNVLQPAQTISVVKQLRNTFGLGTRLARVICAQVGINPNTPIQRVARTYWQMLLEQIEQNFFVDMELKRLVEQDVERLMIQGCYRGLRHHDGFPCRGQRTHTNAHTVKRVNLRVRVRTRF